MVGLKRGVVELKPYNPKWKDLFAQESKVIASAISDFLVDIQHMGSTAIPDIVAKPIIDIALAINSLENIEKIIAPLEKIGFIYRGEQGIPDRHLFVKGGEELRTHHLHVMFNEHYEWKKHMAFRDYLLANPEEAREYSELKKKLKQEYKDDRVAYTDSKTEFINGILEKAMKSD
ncbi:MAG: GrpB family protein [Candidatus Heimdallarchaeota archaeon]|nr:GrpB family protein [Candidatus Heimdallarchaeota archaeon]